MNIPRGREDVARLFQNSISRGKLSQAYIINAPSGMGKKTVTQYILSLIVCSSHSSCGVCPSCLSHDAKCHPDVVYLRRDEDKASLGVENVRAIKTEVYTRPVMSDYKVIVAEEMHLATVGAQNAMLKIIEEPPQNVVFIMLCDTLSPILPTILSRSVVVDLKPLSKEALSCIEGADDFLVSVSEGNPGKLTKLIEDADYTAFRDEVADAFFSLEDKDPYAPYRAAQRLDKFKTKSDEVFSLMLICARDAYFFKQGITDRIVNKDKLNYISSFASSLSPDKLWSIMDIIIKTIGEKGPSGNFTMAVTILLLKCRSVRRKE